MGVRGYEWAVYIDDDDNRWLLQVDADYFSDPDRGWSARTSDDTLIWPRGWRARAVEGIETSGRRQRSLVGSVTAALWTREATSFVVNASDELPVAVEVIRYLAEKRRPAPPPLP